jgi:hypothetical protein
MADNISSRIVKWLANTIWPWILKYLWPVIQKAIVHIFVLVVENFILRVFNYFKERKINQAEEALKKAAEADARAKNSENEMEAEKHRTVANVWRQVADDYTKEDKNLREKLNSFAMDATSDFERQIESLKNDKTFGENIQKSIAESPPPSLLTNPKSSEGDEVNQPT